MRDMKESEKQVFERKKAIKERREKRDVGKMKQDVADFFGMRWEDVMPKEGER